MFNTINGLSSGQSVFLYVTIVAVILFIIISLTLIKKKETFKASDGSLFMNKEDYEIYENLTIKLAPLFNDSKGNDKLINSLGLDTTFVDLLKNKGFKDLKSIIIYKEQFATLSILLNQS